MRDFRWAAYWSALTTLARYDRPSRLRITVDGRTDHWRSPMVFVAQNAYQLQQYGLTEGVDLIRQGKLTGYRLNNRIIRVDLAEVDACFQPIPTTGR